MRAARRPVHDEGGFGVGSSAAAAGMTS